MISRLTSFVGRLVRPLWIAGPIFDKELRVSSRRRRNYLLRFVYLVVLILFLSLMWTTTVRSTSSTGLYAVSRMAEAGKGIIAFIVWFEFCAIQIIAVIALSTSISDEISNRTLGALMTTPINSFQIVMGKLFSKLLQLILLLAISLPLLATVRVFGGVQWDYVVSGLCITLTTTIFLGSLSLFFSIFNRRAYVVIITTAVAALIIFALLPFLVGFGWKAVAGRWPSRTVTAIIFCPNPYYTMFFQTIGMLEPRSAGGIPRVFWLIHCASMLLASIFVLMLAIVCVRRVALRQAVGQTGTPRRIRRQAKPGTQPSLEQTKPHTRPKRVKGPPVLWKELRSPLFGKRKLLTYIVAFAAFVLILVSYGLFAREKLLDDRTTHMAYVVIFLALGMLLSAVLPATSICSEKEARSWPLLLSTTLTDRQILLAKFVGTLRRCLLAWSLLLGHLAFFTLTGFIHPVGLLQFAMLITWVSVFLAGTGLFFSSRCKRTTTSVIANLAMAGCLWVIMPLVIVISAQISRAGRDIAGVCADANPFVQAICIINAVARDGRIGRYDWLALDSSDATAATIWISLCLVMYVSAGLLFLWRAKSHLRRSIF